MNKVAWYVSDGDEAADIVFAATEDQAIALGARRLLSDRESVEVKRSPFFDEFAKLGYAPAEAWIKWGAWLECHWCGRRVDDECWDYDEDEPIEPVFDRSRVFCCQECSDRWHENQDIRKIRERQAKAVLLSMFSGIHSLSVWNSGKDYETYAEFKAPGCKYKIEWRSDSAGSVWVTPHDQDAWLEFKKAIARK